MTGTGRERDGREGEARDEAARLSERCRLYLVTPPAIELATFPAELAAALDAGDVACLQIRLKDVTDEAIRRAATAIVPIAQERGVAVLMNDRPDLAIETGCDGAHVGQTDTKAREARRFLGGLTMGVTCHASLDLAFAACEDGADYVAFGAFFATTTKEAPTRAPAELLTWWSDIATIPCVAIGGITAANCAPLVRAGADFLAVVGAVWSHPDGPAAGVRAMNAAIDAA